MDRLKKSKKGIGEVPLFRSLSIFLTELTPIVVNMQKDIKLTFGYRLLGDCYDIVGAVRRCYDIADIKGKYKVCNDMIATFSVVETQVKLLSELKHIGINASANLMLRMGDILIQMNGWKANLEKRLNCS